MSLGSNYNNNQKKNSVYDPTVYSPYRMNNAESKVDATCITFSYWRNLLRIGIAPKKDTGNDEVRFDIDNAIYIYLSHSKARIFADILKKFLAEPDKYDNSGVPSRDNIITISTGKAYNSISPVIAIKKVDSEGHVVSDYAYQTKNDYYFGIRDYDHQSGSFTKDTASYDTMEIEMLITLLEEYYKAMTSAIAYSVLDNFKFEHNRMTTRIDKIAEKLGVEVNSGNGSKSNYSSTSYFTNNSGNSNSGSGSNYTQATMDDIE